VAGETNPHQDEIDFLMEHQYVLQSELTRVNDRLEHLLGATVTRHLVAVKDLPDEPA
jgi:hypothetical protein